MDVRVRADLRAGGSGSRDVRTAAEGEHPLLGRRRHQRHAPGVTGVPEPAAPRRRAGLVERVKVAGKLGLPVRVMRKGLASGEGWTAELDQEMGRGLDDALADARHSRRQRRHPAWLVSQPPLYVW